MTLRNILPVNFIFSILLFSSFTTNKDNTVKLTIHLDSEIRDESQWIYWFSLYKNEYSILDSCYIQKGDSICQMSKPLEDNYELTIYLLPCSKEGSASSALSLLPGEDVDVYIKKNNSLFLETKGSVGTEEMNSYWSKASIIGKKVASLNLKFENEKDIIIKKQISDSLKYYKEYFHRGLSLELFHKAVHPRTYALLLNFLESSITDQEDDSLRNVFKSKFPYSNAVQTYGEKSPPATEKSRYAQKRYSEILKGRNSLTRQDIATSKAEIKVCNLKIGDKIDCLSLISPSGKHISLDSIKTPYILIDFWASWCVPCVREFPFLKNAYTKYKHNLTIYSISKCNSKEDWLNAIQRYEVCDFLHVYGGSPMSLAGQTLSGRFGVTAIPANFLLDKDHKIIAMNLRGNALEKIMKELIGK